MIHAAESYALAVLENLVHFNLGEQPPHLIAVQLRIPASVSREIAGPEKIKGWQTSQPNHACQEFGNRWYDAQRSAVLVVPSVLSPHEQNMLINQAHPESRYIEVGTPTPASLDERLLRMLHDRSGQLTG